MTWSPSCTWVTWWPVGDDHASRLMPQQGGIDGRCAAVRGLGCAMDLVQLGVTDPACKKSDQYLIRLRIREGDMIDNQWRVRCNEDGGSGARRHGFPPLERHVATAIAVARFLEYSGKSSARCPSRYESYRHLETSTLPYMVVLGQVSMQRLCMECTPPSLRCILLCSVATFEPLTNRYASALGNVSAKVVPCPGALCTLTCPPCVAAISCTM